MADDGLSKDENQKREGSCRLIRVPTTNKETRDRRQFLSLIGQIRDHGALAYGSSTQE
jgi:hypothetical protein